MEMSLPFFFSEHREEQREGEKDEDWWKVGKLTVKDIVIPANAFGRLGPSCFSAAHMDKINLCVYDRLIYAPVALGASFLLVKPFVCY